jgi:competence protein ComEC
MARNRPLLVILLTATFVLFLLALAALRGSLRIAAIPLAAAWMAIGCLCSEIHPAPPSQPALTSYADGLSRQVHGRVTRVRELPPAQQNSDHDIEAGWWPEKEASVVGLLSVDIDIDSIEEVTPDVSRMVPITGGVRLSVIRNSATAKTTGNTSLPTFKCGDVIEAPMRIKLPERYRDPGAWQYADYLLAQGIGAHASVQSSKITFLNKPDNGLTALSDTKSQLQCRIYTAQSWASKRLIAYVNSNANRELPRTLQLSPDDAGMLNAMLFGDRAGLNSTQRIGFERTGSFHLFVVSGMHVGLLAGIIFWLARRLKLHDWLATLITTVLTFAYALLTGFGAPVQRALIMTTIFLVARLLSRDRNVLNALGAAALAVLVWSPSALFEASFQMTFLAIIAIAGIATPLAERSFLSYARASAHLRERWRDAAMPPRVAQFRVMLRLWNEVIEGIIGDWLPNPSLLVRVSFWTAEIALIGAVAEIVMVLPMALYFHRATMFAAPANMFSVPLVAVLAPVALVTFCASLIHPWAATLPGATTALLLHGIAGVIGRVSGMHGADLRVPAPVGWIALLAVGGWAWCCWAVRRSRNWTLAAVVLLPLIGVMILWPGHPRLTPGMMEVTAIDVGQGDSILVIDPNGETMLVDAGGPVGGLTEVAEAASRFDVGEELVSPYLWSRRLRRLDVLVLSHAHSDHMGGMPAVMRNFRPRELWVSIDPNSSAYRALLAEAKDLDVKVRHLHAGDQLVWGGTEVTILAPEASYSNPHEPVNNDSLVLRLQYGRSSVLLEGDAEVPSERQMLAHGRVAPVTLLKVGHHGSRTSTSEAFLAAAAPRDAVVSSGKGNQFGHPRYEVIDHIAAAGSKLYRTDEFGLTTFLLDRDGELREIVGAADQ